MRKVINALHFHAKFVTSIGFFVSSTLPVPLQSLKSTITYNLANFGYKLCFKHILRQISTAKGAAINIKNKETIHSFRILLYDKNNIIHHFKNSHS